MDPSAVPVSLTPPSVVVLALVTFTAYLFVSGRLRPDVTAVLMLSLLGVLSTVPGFQEVISAETLYSGFASDAVIAIIAVMVIGAGLDRTGIMGWVAGWILSVGGNREHRIVGLLCASAGLLSAFVQNVGVMALYLPVVARVAARSGIPVARLLIPVGFCVILGGTITLVGNSPLILLNELVNQNNQSLPAGERVTPFELFSIAPAGLLLLGTGVALFTLVGRYLLPMGTPSRGFGGTRALDYFQRVYGLDASVHEVVVRPGSSLVGRSIREIQEECHVRIIATHYAGRTRIATPVSVTIAAPSVLAVIADPAWVEHFALTHDLRVRKSTQTFFEALMPTRAGIAELVIPPNSDLIGKTIRGVRMRETHGLTILTIHRAGESLHDHLPEIPLQSGDTLVCHTSWRALRRLERSADFVVVTTEYPREEERPQKLLSALMFFLLALGLALFTDIRLGAAMLAGAIGMVLSGVLSMDEAYEAVSWRTVFLLAGLMPLGQAMQSTGAAGWVAEQFVAVTDTLPAWGSQVGLALLASGFSLLISNVGATILLVPIAMNIAASSGADPTLYALIVALSTSNSFLIPTNQVNALIMGPGGYRSGDFLRAGTGMTVVFLLVSLVILNLMY